MPKCLLILNIIVNVLKMFIDIKYFSRCAENLYRTYVP